MRKIFFPTIIIIVVIILISRLFYLQIIDDSYIKKSDLNALKIEYEYPERGYIYDRNGKLLVANQPSYDIMVIPNEIKNIDTLEFCSILNITATEFEKKINKAKTYSPRLPSVFISQLTKKEFAGFQEKIRHYKGFYIQKRNLRDYQVNYGGNIFGYIRQINERELSLKKNTYYKSGDLIGIQGVEQAYENDLRGQKGIKYIQRDRLNKEIGSFKNGKYDTLAIKGADITITIDAQLQEYGEKLMNHKRGGIIAIEPSTGEILALVSAPVYNPALLVGKERSRNYRMIDSIPGKPFFNRILQAEYAPGSPFKILTGLIGLQEEVIDSNTRFTCAHGFSYAKGRFMRCHDAGSWNIHKAIALSCNTYFSQTYKRIVDKNGKSFEGLSKWNHHLQSFGLGNFLGYDLPIGQKGNIPNTEYYDKIYGKKRWKATTNISNAIGQGEVTVTPIQLANVMCAVANRGFYKTPHIIKDIEGKKINKSFVQKKQTSIDPKHYEPIINGLLEVYTSGTASRLKIPNLDICGKTGTVENFVSLNGKRTQLEDHSVFLSFAPKENPKIVVAVFIENGGFGASWAGPIATLMIDKYLNNDIIRKDLEEKMLNGSIEKNYLYKDKVEKIKELRNNIKYELKKHKKI